MSASVEACFVFYKKEGHIIRGCPDMTLHYYTLLVSDEMLAGS